ncbi:hypothetical protein [Butyrivibrio sp. AE2032]|uniref:hypothetical protein n=1 Tax=Butyrivibrio sp. AE2032 TaxID=1458463 RepID=UPI000550E9EA|nr:hypothetical protein [Butyrivibrio sp. AE2032]
MGLFGKKESNAEYQSLKNSVINDWSHLTNDNISASPEELKNQWSSLSQQLNKAYKLSQKYKDTGNDIPLFKSYLDEAASRIKKYSFEIEYAKYKAEYSNVCKEYEEIIGAQYNDNASSVWNDYYELMMRFEKLNKRANWLQKQLPTYRQYDIDERVVNEIYSNTAFFYCASILYLTENKEEEYDEKKRDAYYQYLRKCEAVAKQFAEGRFKTMRGISCNRRALFIQIYDNRHGRNDPIVVNSVLREAKPGLSIVENIDYCSSVVQKYSGNSVLNAWEWNFMITAMEDLCNIYKFEGNHQKARDVVNVSIEAHQKANTLGNWDDLIKSMIELRNGII